MLLAMGLTCGKCKIAMWGKVKEAYKSLDVTEDLLRDTFKGHCMNMKKNKNTFQ